jgi:hypothetical protein
VDSWFNKIPYLPDIGTGRREADMLVPYQNALGEILTQVNAAIDAGIDAEGLRGLRATLVAAMDRYQAILAEPWSDGRAARQGYETMFGNPGYARVTLENLDRAIAQRGGGVSGVLADVSAVSGSNGGLILAAAAAFLFLKK